jgi:cyclic-di-GMP-binding protein
MSLTNKLNLPAATGEPRFVSVAECKDWVRELPVTNVREAQAKLLAEVRGVASAAPTLLFGLLETLRDAVYAVQSEAALKFTHHPLPLGDEQAIFDDTLALWQAFGQGYQRVAVAWSADDRDMKAMAPTLMYRAIDAQARLLLDYHRANTVAPHAQWTILHALFTAAEDMGVAAEKVTDPVLKSSRETHAMAAYAAPLLMSLSSPNELGAKQQGQVERWLDMWARKITVRKLKPAAPAEGSSEEPLWVDVGRPHGAFRPPQGFAPVPTIRYVDVNDLSHSIKGRVMRLRAGDTPQSLGLGDDAVQPACEQLLVNLYRRWCGNSVSAPGGATVERQHARRAASGAVQVSYGMGAAHYYVGGMPFQPPVDLAKLSAQQEQEMATFGRLSTKAMDDYSQMKGYVMEQWSMEDESPGGMRLRRVADASADRPMRIAQNLLVVVKPPGAKVFQLGVVRWMSQLGNRDIMCGVRLVPGLPRAYAARAYGIGGNESATTDWKEALLLPAMETMKAPESLVLPSGFARAARVIELHAERHWKIQVNEVLERADGCDRVSFSSLK